jgi:hypothetical protein
VGFVQATPVNATVKSKLGRAKRVQFIDSPFGLCFLFLVLLAYNRGGPQILQSS